MVISVSQTGSPVFRMLQLIPEAGFPAPLQPEQQQELISRIQAPIFFSLK